jgi:hypothetical protein
VEEDGEGEKGEGAVGETVRKGEEAIGRKGEEGESVNKLVDSIGAASKRVESVGRRGRLDKRVRVISVVVGREGKRVGPGRVAEQRRRGAAVERDRGEEEQVLENTEERDHSRDHADNQVGYPAAVQLRVFCQLQEDCAAVHPVLLYHLAITGYQVAGFVG